MQAVFCSGVKSFAILGLVHYSRGLALKTAEQAVFLAASKELFYARSDDPLFAEDYPALFEAACIVNKRENWFWQVGYEKRRMGDARARQRICLALPASMGARWVSSELTGVDFENHGVDVLGEVEAFRGLCDNHLYELDRVFKNGDKSYVPLPIHQSAANAWRAVLTMGGFLLLMSSPRLSYGHAEVEASHVA